MYQITIRPYFNEQFYIMLYVYVIVCCHHLRFFDMSFQENVKTCFFAILKKKCKICILEHWAVPNRVLIVFGQIRTVPRINKCMVLNTLINIMGADKTDCFVHVVNNRLFS